MRLLADCTGVRLLSRPGAGRIVGDMDDGLPDKARVLRIARSNGGQMIFIGTRKARRGGEEHRYACVQCGRSDHYLQHPAALGNARVLTASPAVPGG